MGDINLLARIESLANKFKKAITTSDKASKSKFGIVKIGNGIDVASGVISVNATSDYSATEKEIGKWVDGTTKVYEKTFALTDQSAGSGTDVELGEIPGVDRVLEITGTISSSNKSTYYANEYYSSAGKYSYFYVEKGDTNKVKFKTSDSWSSTNLTCRVRYTKTS